MKLRSLFFIAFAVGILASCGVDDLEDRLDKVENSLGTNEPISVNFKTTNYDDVEIVEKTSYLFKAKGYNQYMEDNGDGTYYVYVERFADVGWNEGAWVEFNYNPTTKEATNIESRIYFYDQFGNYLNPRFSEDSYVGNTTSLTVSSFNTETGAVNLTLDASTDATATNNEFEGEPMSCSFSFKGKLEVFLND